MKKLWIATMLIFGISLRAAPPGMVEFVSRYDVEHTVRRLINDLRERGIRLVKVVDHAEGARSVNMKLRPTKLVIFGNPYIGTPLMQCAQTLAIDLPQKMLVYQNVKGEVIVAYNDPRYLFRRHGVRRDCSAEIQKKVKVVLAKLAKYAAGEEE